MTGVQKKIVFIGGVARSGTSALAKLLNTHPLILMGSERYFNLINHDKLTWDYLLRDRFCSIEPGDTHGHGGFHFGPSMEHIAKLPALAERYDQAIVVGDKFPNLFRHYGKIFGEFKNAHLIYILRNPFSVAESYQVRSEDGSDTLWSSSNDHREAIKDWNESVRRTLELVDMRGADKLVLVEYEDIFSDYGALGQMFSAIGLDAAKGPEVEAIFAKFGELNAKMVPRRDDIRQIVAKTADWGAYNALLQKVRDHKKKVHAA